MTIPKLNVHFDGIPWHEAPIPRRLHRCKVQTAGTLVGSEIDRCACGGIRWDNGIWFERNSRRKEARRRG